MRERAKKVEGLRDGQEKNSEVFLEIHYYFNGTAMCTTEHCKVKIPVLRLPFEKLWEFCAQTVYKTHLNNWI